ncbi:glycosyltransferase family 2 protein [Vibrio splendidus]|uniref:glycosyltransferase family 2 protein n=1 Tax=Vibrio splendidus TaxID=29497 RepID=UPI000C8499EC|nr:glycosyltransferase family 2 protein [Vibrio splendidus]PMI50818.1 glycosyltransferase [Vibrio splendidus]
MNDNPVNQSLVSVGIPTYNRPEELDQCLTLIRKQTYKNIEIIVSDNASEKSDIIEQVVNKHISEDSRIRFYQQEDNIGSIGNFRFVLEKASADFFMWAADDDELEFNYIEMLLPELKTTEEYGFVVSGYDVVDKMCNPPFKSDFTKYLHDIPAETAYKRMKNYILQPDYCGKSKILWSLHRTQLVKKAFENVFVGLPVKDDTTWAELPVEFRLLSMCKLAVVDDVLFHANLLPSSEGMREGSLFNNREIEVCNRSFAAYTRAVVQSEHLSAKEKNRLIVLLKWEEFLSVSRMVVYGFIRRRSPTLARKIKKLWMSIVAGK